MDDFHVDYIQEPHLLFKNGGTSLNPCIGLIKYGPRFSGLQIQDLREFKVGIIGSSKSIALTKQLFKSFQNKISPSGEIKPWKIPFPGLDSSSNLGFKFVFNPEWESVIDMHDFHEIKNARFSSKKALDIIKWKLKIIYEKETPPDIILISIPQQFYEICECSGTNKPTIKVGVDDFHSRIKLVGMQLKIPTQVIRYETLLLKGTQERCLVAWNIVVGMLYKCQRGHPWKLTHLEENTCYVGISFFKEKGEETRRASLAQIFLDTGESFVLRGESFSWINKEYPNSPHLSKNDAYNLITYVLEHYKSIRKNYPSRIVVHKSSNFWDDELEGFKDATNNVELRDFITILNSNLKLFTQTSYPVLRGTFLSLKDESIGFLFTTGFVPSLGTYPGFSIPSALKIKPFNLDTSLLQVCQEIISLTKLDWNNTFVYSKMPVTISVSRKVGKVMGETEAQNMEYLDPHYYFYM
ncbi:hypothetical protein HWN40_03550 [Methanolobus zinderi]|uniref:Piwi domain-containing protein n=1 Tax=Methanolobus zinderi TaxID=536044 RepID=A0A7D5I482_9EURY|nr:hypothetical protein [Methanolobus zinderi]QLC49401.1 hypothetical protein HWN40_03550 [Methanolobus zinderi]